MDKQILEKATEDISLIKQVIEQTSSSLISFSRIFLWWGVLLSVSAIVGIIGHFNPSYIFESSFFHYIFVTVFFVIGLIIYINISRKCPLLGLSRQLMTLWLYIIAFDLLIICVPPILSSTLKVPYYDSFPMFLMSFAFGFICTSIFTRLKLPGFLAFFYVFLAIFFMQMADILPYSISFKMPYICGFIFPTSFLMLGGYLEFIRVRRN